MCNAKRDMPIGQIENDHGYAPTWFCALVSSPSNRKTDAREVFRQSPRETILEGGL